MRLRIAPLVVLVMVSLAACSASPGASPAASAGSYSLLPAIVSTELAVGPNRVVFSFLDPKTNTPAATPDLAVTVKAYPDAKGPSAAVTGEGHFVWATQDVNGFYYTYLTFEEAASVPMAGLTALQGLRDHGKLEAGEHVLVNGASGGVGTFAVQIAKALGGEVTAAACIIELSFLNGRSRLDVPFTTAVSYDR